MRAEVLCRRQFLQGSLGLLGLGLVTGCGGFPVAARQPKMVPRIGVLITDTRPAGRAVFRPLVEAIRELGHVEGRDFIFVTRYAGTSLDRLPELAAELVDQSVDLIVTLGGPSGSAHALRQATSAIPIVMAHSGNDPVSEGLVASLSHPGGNLTGVATSSDRLTQKRLELLRDSVPGLARVGVLWRGSGSAMRRQVAEAVAAAPALGLQIVPLEIEPQANAEPAFAAGSAADIQALMVLWGPLIGYDFPEIASLTARTRWPSMAEYRGWADIGGLLAYGPNLADLQRRAATYVVKILQGARPADLPVEQPTRFDFVINLKTVQRLGLTIPQSVLQQTTDLIQ